MLFVLCALFSRGCALHRTAWHDIQEQKVEERGRSEKETLKWQAARDEVGLATQPDELPDRLTRETAVSRSRRREREIRGTKKERDEIAARQAEEERQAIKDTWTRRYHRSGSTPSGSALRPRR